MSNRSKALEPRVLAALRTGQMHRRMLCNALGRDYLVVGATVTELCRRREVVVLGKSEDAGYTDIGANAPVYGLPGTTLVRVAAKPKRTASSSGVVAAPKDHDAEFRPLRRDPFSHMTLAMVTRR